MSVIVVSCALFGIGLCGVLVRREIVAVLASVEVMLGGPLLLLVGLSASETGAGSARVHAAAVVVLVVIAAEAAVGLALLVAVARAAGTTRIDELTEGRG
jgi:NADH-quinone oxidoreductase subunit K